MDVGRLERKARVAELMLDAARQLGETLEPERVYERFHELLGELVPHDGLVVSSYEERDDLIGCDYAWVEGNVVDPSTLPPLPLNREGGGMQSRVIVSGEPLIFNDIAERVQDPGGRFYNVDREGRVEQISESEEAGSTAAMMVPVKHEGRVVGVVQVMRDSGAYSEDELELVEGLVAQMAAAVRVARLRRERSRLEAAEAAALAVAAEREQAARVLDAVGDGIFLVDDGCVRVWNRAAELILGIQRADVVDRPLADTIPEWEGLAERIPVAEAGETPRPVALPVEHGGRDLWLSFVAVHGAVGTVYAFRDVTSERRVEELQSDFIATISHELRTPMAGVYGAAETLLHREAELTLDLRRRLVEMIATQSTRMTKIVEDILLTSKLDRGELAIDREPVDVVDVVRATIDALDASVSVEAEDTVGAASADRDRLQQVLVNLLDNALKYGEPPVEVRVAAQNGFVRVDVVDHGPGIPPAEQARIFEKFYRADPQQTRAPGGTGLGLYISRELVRRMDGRLAVSSAPGEGATFVVELPRA